MSQILSEVRGSVALITLNRPEKRNALCQSLIQELTQALENAIQNESVRSLILTGSGTVFCAGMDLDELRASLTTDEGSHLRDALQLGVLFNTLANSPKPTIAAVNGAAIAGGAGLVSMCDFAVSVPEAKFGYPEVRRGLVAAMVMPPLLRLVGERRAKYLLLTGELIDANHAVEYGLINRIAESGVLLESALEYATLVEQGGPLAIAATKKLLGDLAVVPQSMEALAQASATPRSTPECRNRLTAFFEKK